MYSPNVIIVIEVICNVYKHDLCICWLAQAKVCAFVFNIEFTHFTSSR